MMATVSLNTVGCVDLNGTISGIEWTESTHGSEAYAREKRHDALHCRCIFELHI